MAVDGSREVLTWETCSLSSVPVFTDNTTPVGLFYVISPYWPHQFLISMEIWGSFMSCCVFLGTVITKRKSIILKYPFYTKATGPEEATKMLWWLEHSPTKTRRTGGVHMEKRKPGETSETLPVPEGGLEGQGLFLWAHSERSRGNAFKLAKLRV